MARPGPLYTGTSCLNDKSSQHLKVQTFPISNNTVCDVIKGEMPRDTYEDSNQTSQIFITSNFMMAIGYLSAENEST